MFMDSRLRGNDEGLMEVLNLQYPIVRNPPGKAGPAGGLLDFCTGAGMIASSAGERRVETVPIGITAGISGDWRENVRQSRRYGH
jgi:hypothetical protein